MAGWDFVLARACFSRVMIWEDHIQSHLRTPCVVIGVSGGRLSGILLVPRFLRLDLR